MARDVHIHFPGRLGNDPEIEYLTDGNVVAKLRVVANPSKYDRDTDTWSDQGEAQWYTVRIWGEHAETAANVFTKGSEIDVEGNLRIRAWTRDDGKQRYDNEIYAARIRSIPSFDSARPARDD